MTSASTTLHGPMRLGWARVGAVASAALSTAPFWWDPAGWWRGDAVHLVAALVLASLVAALAFRAWVPRVAGAAVSGAAQRAIVPSFFMTAATTLCVLGWTRIRSFGESYGDALWMYPAMGIPLLMPFTLPWDEPRDRGPPGGERLAQRLWGALLLAVVAVACARSLVQPPFVSSEAWIRALPVVGAIPAVAPGALGGDHVVDGTLVRRRCDGRVCRLSIVLPSGGPTFAQWRAAERAAVVRHDARTDALVFVSDGDRHALHRATGAYLNLRAWHMNRGHAPPRAWVGAALAGGLVAALLFRATRRAPAVLLRWRGARAGVLAEGGVVALDDGGVARLPAGHGLPPGSVMVRFRREALGGVPFRGAAVGEVVEAAAGTPADVERAIAQAEEGAATYAVAVAATACGPLLVEAACQIAG